MTTSEYVSAEPNLSQLRIGVGIARRRLSLVDKSDRPARWVAGLSYATAAVVSLGIWAGVFSVVSHLAS